MYFRIVYTSRATRALTRAELHDLCLMAADRNQRDHITGLFLFDGIRFLQALEGTEATVQATMGRIKNDERHTEISYSFYGEVERREFPNWSMEEPFGPGTDPDLFRRKVRSDVEHVSDRHLQAEFIGFARLAATPRSRV